MEISCPPLLPAKSFGKDRRKRAAQHRNRNQPGTDDADRKQQIGHVSSQWFQGHRRLLDSVNLMHATIVQHCSGRQDDKIHHKSGNGHPEIHVLVHGLVSFLMTIRCFLCVLDSSTTTDACQKEKIGRDCGAEYSQQG